jgi:hypothetical protein
MRILLSFENFTGFGGTEAYTARVDIAWPAASLCRRTGCGTSATSSDGSR